MVDSVNPRGDLFKSVLDAYRVEYGELYQTWRSIDTKAQGNVAIAGIFLAGLFVYVKDIDPAGLWWQKTVLVVSGCALVFSVLIAVLVLQVRIRWSPQVGKNIEKLAHDLLDLSDESDMGNRLPAFQSDQVEGWKNSVDKIREIVTGKANKLYCAQVLLAVGVVCIAIITILKIVET
jgi:hypothetical protein